MSTLPLPMVTVPLSVANVNESEVLVADLILKFCGFCETRAADTTDSVPSAATLLSAQPSARRALYDPWVKDALSDEAFGSASESSVATGEPVGLLIVNVALRSRKVPCVGVMSGKVN